jgi:ADP-ribose pyrophosphatase YjhB (NUDIX family)
MSGMGKRQGHFEGLPVAAEASVDLLQLGTIPFRIEDDGRPVFFLVTTRGSGRWTIPKGNPIAGLPPHKAAAREAREEAGLVGKARKKPLGSYRFWKRREDHWVLASVSVHLMKVEDRLADFKESAERSVGLFSPEDAALAVVEPGLKSLMIAAAVAIVEKGSKRKRKGKGRVGAGARRRPGSI